MGGVLTLLTIKVKLKPVKTDYRKIPRTPQKNILHFLAESKYFSFQFSLF